MGLWDNKDDAPNDAPKAKKPGGIEGMIMGFIADNPQIKEAIEGFQGALVAFAEQGRRIEAQNVQILENQARIMEAIGTLRIPQSGPNITGNGVISDGRSCPSCGTTGECGCFTGDGGGDAGEYAGLAGGDASGVCAS